MLNELIRAEVRDLKPYHANQIACKYKMDANESPFDITVEFKSRLSEIILNTPELNLYPDTDSTLLRKALSEKWNVSDNMIMVGNGSDQVIQVLINTFVGKGDKVLFPVPSFSMYSITTKIAGGTPVSFILKEENNFKYDVKEILDTAEKERPKIIFLCTPNNPTGNVLELSEIEEIVKKSPNSIIAVDEAYAEFGGVSAVSLINKYKNLIILRTFSKALGLAGVRCGYSISNRDLTEYLNKVRPPYNLNSFTQKAALLCLENSTIIDNNIEYIKSERNHIYDRLLEIPYINPFNSSANFLLIKCTDIDCTFNSLLKDGILVRSFKGAIEIENCIRVTIGNSEQNEAFLKSIKNI